MSTDEETENNLAGKRYALNLNILQQTFNTELRDRFALLSPHGEGVIKGTLKTLAPLHPSSKPRLVRIQFAVDSTTRIP